jgi:hypothetical protein
MMDEDFRNSVFNNLNLLETDDLIEIWQNNNRAEWSDTAFEVVQQILRTRLGQLPQQDEPTYENSEQDMNDESDEKISEIIDLAEDNDINGLVEIINNEPNQKIRLEAAMTLAQLEDERGLDFLIYALNNPDSDVNTAARKILIELNNPKGNLALQSK